MKIEGNTIFFKSNSDLYKKEKSGLKPNTVRRFNDLNEFELFLKFKSEFEDRNDKKIIISKENTIRSFERKIKDISQIPGTKWFVISWIEEKILF